MCKCFSSGQSGQADKNTNSTPDQAAVKRYITTYGIFSRKKYTICCILLGFLENNRVTVISEKYICQADFKADKKIRFV